MVAYGHTSKQCLKLLYIIYLGKSFLILMCYLPEILSCYVPTYLPMPQNVLL